MKRMGEIRVLFETDDSKQRFSCKSATELSDGCASISRQPSLTPPRNSESQASIAWPLSPAFRCRYCDGNLVFELGHKDRLRESRCDVGRCGLCGGSSTVASVIHRCVHCATAIESPSDSVGRGFICPSCNKGLTVPPSLFLFEDDPIVNPSDHFLVSCAACDSKLVAPFSKLGLETPCLYCYTSMYIPAAGDYVGNDQSDAGGKLVSWECASCGQRIPKTLADCPMCGASV